SGALHHPSAADRRLRRASLRRPQAAESRPDALLRGAAVRRRTDRGAGADARWRYGDHPSSPSRRRATAPRRAGRRVTADRDPEEPASPAEGESFVPRRHAFSLVAIGVLAIWKIYQAIAADSARAAIPPSMYILGLAGFAVSILGPRSLQLATFLAGA